MPRASRPPRRARSKGEEGDAGPRDACEAGVGKLRGLHPIAGQWVFHGAGVARGIYHPRGRRPPAPPPGNGFWSRNCILRFRQDSRVLCDARGALGWGIPQAGEAQGTRKTLRSCRGAETAGRGDMAGPSSNSRPVTRVASRGRDLPDKVETGNRRRQTREPGSRNRGPGLCPAQRPCSKEAAQRKKGEQVGLVDRSCLAQVPERINPL